MKMELKLKPRTDTDFLFCKFGVGVTWGQNPNIFKPRQIIYQNEALCLVIKKKWFSRSSEVIRPQNEGVWGHFGSKFKNFQTWTNYIPKMKLSVP